MSDPTLAIETSGGGGTVALVDGATVEQRELDRSGRRHARTLIPAMRSLLQDHGVGPDRVARVCVSAGPGSFTGLRVGIAAAKTFAWAIGTPLYGVRTHEAIRSRAIREGRVDPSTAVCVVSNAERGQVFATTFAGGAASPMALLAPDRLPEDVPLVGTLPRRVAETVDREWAAADMTADATAVADLGTAYAGQGVSPDDPYTLLPLYGRRSAAEEQRDA